jgi:type II secretory pathway pseudopilin PulG
MGRLLPTIPRRTRRPGFTLIEAAVTTVIVGVGFVSMLELLAAGTMANKTGADLTTAMNLAGNVREAMTGLSYTDPTSPTHWGPETGEGSVAAYDDLDDFDGWTSSPNPPIDARRLSLGSDYAAWTQEVKVESVRPDNLRLVMSHMTLTPDLRPTCRCTVTIKHNGRNVYTQSWISAYADASAP